MTLVLKSFKGGYMKWIVECRWYKQTGLPEGDQSENEGAELLSKPLPTERQRWEVSHFFPYPFIWESTPME